MDYLRELIDRYPRLSDAGDDILGAYRLLVDAFSSGRKLLVAGNGGSAADAEHITGELMKSFVKKRPLPYDFKSRLDKVDSGYSAYLGNSIQCGLPVIPLSSQAALLTAVINDINGDIVYAQQIYGFGNSGDIFLGISTSGNSKNILYAMITARAMNMKTIALTGASGGEIKKYADVSIIVPEKETYKIQELHLPVYHALCLMIEDHFYS